MTKKLALIDWRLQIELADRGNFWVREHWKHRESCTAGSCIGETRLLLLLFLIGREPEYS
jgi:hypothetical protein